VKSRDAIVIFLLPVLGELGQTGGRTVKPMTRLLLSLLMAFPTPALARDMGSADIQIRNDLPIVAQFNAQCVGPMDKWEGPECIVNFSNHRMTVDNSLGITKEQIKSISTNWGSDVRKYIDVLYQASDGTVSLAQFGFRHGNRAKQFLNTLVLFMGGKLVTRN
jgi:hypothetical protein